MMLNADVRKGGCRACFKKNSSLHIWPKNSRTTIFRILAKKILFYLSKILMTFFLVIDFFYDFVACRLHKLALFPVPEINIFLTSIFRRPFLGFYPKILNFYIFSLKNSDDFFFSHLPFFTVFYPSKLLPLPISQHYTPFSTSLHTHMLFSTFLQLAFHSRNSECQ